MSRPGEKKKRYPCRGSEEEKKGERRQLNWLPGKKRIGARAFIVVKARKGRERELFSIPP